MVRYTPEQADVKDHVVNTNGIVLVEAGAGCGKSFMARQVVKELKVKSGIYTAFNKAIVEEGKEKFVGTKMQCKTLHALAYRYVNPTMKISSFTYRCIKEGITYQEKRKIIDVIDTFFVSDSTCMYDYIENAFSKHARKEFMCNLTAKYIEGMAEGEINPTFNFLLKSLHLMLVEKTVNIKVDIVILDEINDVTAVALEIFKLIDAPKKLGLGETNQAIYEFLNLVNGFELLKDDATTLKLTQSYRCSEEIAERIEHKMRKELDENFRFVGTNKPVLNGEKLYCTLTNSAIVDKIQERLAEGQSFTLLRSPSDIFAAPLAVMTASGGKKPFQQKYAYLMDVFDEYTKQSQHKAFFKYLTEELDDDEITSAVRLLQKMAKNKISLFEVYKNAKAAIPDEKYTISTVFTAKGLEFETVEISDDLNQKFSDACEGKLKENEALIIKRCYYVACSRAGLTLLNAKL